MKFATKPIRYYPLHVRHVATLPWEIENANFSADIQEISKKMQTNCILSPLPLLFIHIFQYFKCLK